MTKGLQWERRAWLWDLALGVGLGPSRKPDYPSRKLEPRATSPSRKPSRKLKPRARADSSPTGEKLPRARLEPARAYAYSTRLQQVGTGFSYT